MRIVLVLLAMPFLLFSKPLLLLFSGNEKLSSRELYDTLGLKLPYAIEVWEDQPSMDEIMVSQGVSALVSYYRSKGYFEAKITPTITATHITLEIVENKPVIVSDVQVNSVLDVDQMVELGSKDLFDQDKFSSSKTKIKKRYHEAGYCNATFNSKSWVDLETHEAHLLFEATPNEKCFFGTIAVESTPNIDGNLTKSMLHFDEGDPYSLEAIQKSYEALYAQEAISRVSINDADRIGNTVPITMSIEETEKPIRFSAGLGYSSDQGFGAQMGIKHRNFLGDMKTNDKKQTKRRSKWILKV
jgi:outer membrane protein assembly factor BamA